MDPSLFKLPVVEEEITKIWVSVFTDDTLPSKAWSRAMHEPHVIMRDFRKNSAAQRRKLQKLPMLKVG